MIPTLIELRRKGIHIVRASRDGAGVVIRDGEQPDGRFDWLVMGDQNARIQMLLVLTFASDSCALQDILRKYRSRIRSAIHALSGRLCSRRQSDCPA
ncbi:hypothetical protein [Herbaspirillum robiniae]|uniref:Uncharacterized protein n=1 Tax=Herbaspirillum robiniae TaxID=2014887 RepID=A0ABX2LXW2_9BURK|nr:hypothetical protein [Herbaspirillum robiniae]NUU02946.1 hypothetical protein [Herbaspirillum robiniae]